MNTLERLEETAFSEGVDVLYYPFDSERIRGLYSDGVIAVNSQVQTTAEKACIMAEELGHHYTSHGDILDLSCTENRKQEYRARIWAYKELLTADGLISAFKAGCRNRYEIAEYLDLTEAFIDEGLAYYRTRYPESLKKGAYILYFIPNLRVICLME